jgi:hypothetical protein
MCTISFGQAILLILEKYDLKAIANDQQATVNKLKNIYLSGVKSIKNFNFVLEIFNNDIELSKLYQISIDPKVINSDPSRRYFETKLAHATLLNSIEYLDFNKILEHYHLLYDSLKSQQKNEFDDFFNKMIPSTNNGFAEEYVDACDRVKSDVSYKDLSHENKEKLIYLLKCSWLAVIHGQDFPDAPLQLYGKGLFSPTGRGRTAKSGDPITPIKGSDNIPYYSNNYGLLTSIMPVPRNDVIFTDNGFYFNKPSDKNVYDITGDWPQKNFKQLVHPFSCSISGTLLCQLRMIKYFHETKNIDFTFDQFKLFLQCFTSGLLFNSGGHVYNEFEGVLKLPEVKEAFQYIQGMESITLKTLLLENNEKQFDQALIETIQYNHVILAKSRFHALLLCNRN